MSTHCNGRYVHGWYIRVIAAAMIILTLVVGCGRSEPTVTPVPSTATPMPPTNTLVPPTETPLPPMAEPSLTTTPLPPLAGGGLIAFLSDREANNTELYVMNTDGTGPRRLVPAGDGFIVGLSWSPDGQRIAYTRIVPGESGYLGNHGPFKVWVTTLDGEENVHLSGDIADQILAFPWPTSAWSPDRTRLAFIAARETDGGDLLSSVYVVAADGSGLEWSLPLPWMAFDVFWSPAGDELLLVSSDEETGSSIHTLSLENQELTKIYQGAYAADWSPDGSEIVVSSYQPSDILIVGSEGEQRTIAQLEGRFPLTVKWSPDGRHIVVGSSHSSNLMKITALHLISLETGEVTPIVAYSTGTYIYASNWSPSGDRLLYTTTDMGRIHQGDIFYADLWVYDLTSGEIQRLTSGEFHDGMGVWSPATAPAATKAPTLSPGDTRTRPAGGMVMVYAPGGEFEMSNDADKDGRERPQHSVTLDGFWIDRTEVTNAQFAEFVEDTGYETDAGRAGRGATVPEGGAGWELIEGADWRHPEGPGTDVSARMDHPVVLVSWNDSAAYCEWAGGRLPTEAEWEYAARGPDGHIYPWGDTFDSTLLNFCDANCPFDWKATRYDDGYARTAPVGAFGPGGASWVGALDMAGNIFEWVADWYGDYPSGRQVNPTGPSSGEYKTLHGDAWFVAPHQIRSTGRAGHPPDDASSSSGFRCMSPSTAAQPTSSTLQVPQGNAAAIDGTFSPGEWDGALTTDLTNGGELMLMHAGGYLYLGIRSGAMGFGSICTAGDNQASILHSSAGLGTAIFERDGDDWRRTQQFSYCCWEAARSELDEFLQRDGWVASVGTKGVPEEMEYQIVMNDGSLTLAVVYVDDFTFETALYWPENLDDDCLGLALIPEDPPERLLFSPGTWVTIIASTE